MSLLALGLNHHSAPVDIRERVSIGEESLADALQALRKLDAVNEAAIVSTCNRTEIYCGMREPDAAAIVHWIEQYLDLQQLAISPYLFQHADHDAVRHLMRVCSGLDSMILGEPQILGQIKQAYRDATAAGTMGQELTQLFQTAFTVAKQVRTDTAIGSSPVSVAFAAVSLGRQVFSDFSKHTALLIGAGETVQLAAQHFQSNGIGQLMIANRTVQRATQLAHSVNGTALSLAEIPQVLPQADIILSSTGSPLPILGKGAVEKALKERRYRSQLIVDIAVPRDVEPEVGELDSVFLYSVDDLGDVIEENRQSRRAAADQAEEIVRTQVESFMRSQRAQGATDTILAYRKSVNDTRQQLLDKSRRQLAAGQDPQAVLEHLAHSLSNKLMHAPTQQMREAAASGDHALLDAARALFDLPESRS